MKGPPNRQPAHDFLSALDPEALEVLSDMSSKCPDLVEAFVQTLYGDLYQREGLNLRERVMVAIAAIIVTSDMRPQLIGQVRIALKNGVSREDLMEVARQASVFCGIPKAINAASIIYSVAEEVEQRTTLTDLAAQP